MRCSYAARTLGSEDRSPTAYRARTGISVRTWNRRPVFSSTGGLPLSLKVASPEVLESLLPHLVMLPNRILPIVLLAAMTAPLQGQAPAGEWRLLESSPYADYRHDDASFVSDLEGWVVNLHGAIHHTVDGGETWELQYEGRKQEEDVRFRSVGFATDQIGWAGSLTRRHVLYETRDGGLRTWACATSTSPGDPRAVTAARIATRNIFFIVVFISSSHQESRDMSR